ncbi:hypothetical protein Dimus_007452, partial [Dionaea muscipula]
EDSRAVVGAATVASTRRISSKMSQRQRDAFEGGNASLGYWKEFRAKARVDSMRE